jgi:lipid A disaccharide synthetase
VVRDHPDLTVAVATVEAVCKAVAAAVRNWPLPCLVVTSPTERYDAFATSRAAIAKSGTVTLELALAGVPMVVCYKVGAITGLATRGASGARTNENNLQFLTYFCAQPIGRLHDSNQGTIARKTTCK